MWQMNISQKMTNMYVHGGVSHAAVRRNKCLTGARMVKWAFLIWRAVYMKCPLHETINTSWTFQRVISIQEKGLIELVQNISRNSAKYIIMSIGQLGGRVIFCRFCIVIRGLSIPATTSNDLQLLRISIPYCIHYSVDLSYFWRKSSQYFPFQCCMLNKGTTGFL